MQVTSRISTGGTSRPVSKMLPLHGRNSTATDFDLLRDRTAGEANRDKNTRDKQTRFQKGISNSRSPRWQHLIVPFRRRRIGSGPPKSPADTAQINHAIVA